MALSTSDFPGPDPGTADWFAARAKDRHPGTVALVRYFAWAHLPDFLQAVSRPVGDLVIAMVERLPDGPELTTGLRKLLEAKDCLVRAGLPS